MPALAFDRQCHAAGIPVPVAEYRFAPPRRWRFDWAWPTRAVALEVQGGLWTRGRHTRGAALLKEHEKLNRAAEAGWFVFYCTPQDIANGKALALMERQFGTSGR